MARMFDADALMQAMGVHTYMKSEWTHATAWGVPIVDAEPVVRCKDCKYSVDYYHDGDCYCMNPIMGLLYFGGSWDFYCADGKRREDE